MYIHRLKPYIVDKHISSKCTCINVRMLATHMQTNNHICVNYPHVKHHVSTHPTIDIPTHPIAVLFGTMLPPKNTPPLPNMVNINTYKCLRRCVPCCRLSHNITRALVPKCRTVPERVNPIGDRIAFAMRDRQVLGVCATRFLPKIHMRIVCGTNGATCRELPRDVHRDIPKPRKRCRPKRGICFSGEYIQQFPTRGASISAMSGFKMHIAAAWYDGGLRPVTTPVTSSFRHQNVPTPGPCGRH